jgi:hypothetical protein
MIQAAAHHCRVLNMPLAGVYGTQIESAREYGRHSHATFGFGLLEHGAQRSWSGRGGVEAFAGDVITTNPGEVHDGRPLGSGTRRWRMVYLEPEALASAATNGDELIAAAIELTRPVVRDPSLARSVRALFEWLMPGTPRIAVRRRPRRSRAKRRWFERPRCWWGDTGNAVRSSVWAPTCGACAIASHTGPS